MKPAAVVDSYEIVVLLLGVRDFDAVVEDGPLLPVKSLLELTDCFLGEFFYSVPIHESTPTGLL